MAPSTAAGRRTSTTTAHHDRRGTIVYVGSTLFAAAPDDLLAFALEDTRFPHYSTGNQFLSEEQFRRLADVRGRCHRGGVRATARSSMRWPRRSPSSAAARRSSARAVAPRNPASSASAAAAGVSSPAPTSSSACCQASSPIAGAGQLLQPAEHDRAQLGDTAGGATPGQFAGDGDRRTMLTDRRPQLGEATPVRWRRPRGSAGRRSVPDQGSTPGRDGSAPRRRDRPC